MKKNVLIANLIVWGALLAICIAFQAWYRTAEFEATYAAIQDSRLLQVGLIYSGPILLFALGALLGLAFVWGKKVQMGHGARLAMRIISGLWLGIMALSLVPMLFGVNLTVPVVIVVYLGMLAPAVIAIFGFVYALGLAELDPTKKGPFAKYLPEDDQ